MAPEMFYGKPYKFSILYQCCYGVTPFKESNSEKTIDSILRKSVQFPERGIAAEPNPKRNDFIQSLLCRDTEKRIGSSNDGLGFYADVVSHSWLEKIDWDLLAEKKLAPSFLPMVSVPKMCLCQPNAKNYDRDICLDSKDGDLLSQKFRSQKDKKQSGWFISRVSSFLSKRSQKSTADSRTEAGNDQELPKSREAIELDTMNKFFNAFDWEKPDQEVVTMPQIWTTKPTSSAKLVRKKTNTTGFATPDGNAKEDAAALPRTLPRQKTMEHPATLTRQKTSEKVPSPLRAALQATDSSNQSTSTTQEGDRNSLLTRPRRTLSLLGKEAPTMILETQNRVVEDEIDDGEFKKLVKAIEDKKTKKRYALKFINKNHCIEEKSTTLIFKERIMLQEMCHPFIISLRYAFQDDEHLFMVLELALGGDLRYNMFKAPEFDDYSLTIWVAQIASAINYMHQKMILHRDLKPENLLLDERGNIYLTDLNLATSVEKRKPTSQSGTLDYMAPEMHISKPYSYSIDWWALGTILYECIYRKLPFGGGKTPDEVAENSRSHPLKFSDHSYLRKPVSSVPERVAFISGCLERDIKKRLGSANGGRGFEAEVKTHPYLAHIDWNLLEKKELEPKFKPYIEKDTLNISPNILIEEMLGGQENLAYKPRKKKKDPKDPNRKLTFTEKLTASMTKLFHGSSPTLGDGTPSPPKPKSRKEIEREQMDEYYIPYDWELPNQKAMTLPPEEKKKSSSTKDIHKDTQPKEGGLKEFKPLDKADANATKSSNQSNVSVARLMGPGVVRAEREASSSSLPSAASSNESVGSNPESLNALSQTSLPAAQAPKPPTEGELRIPRSIKPGPVRHSPLADCTTAGNEDDKESTEMLANA
ncbi:hypothetical protein HDU91_005041 [Kappamyces sp. JEL0680]|nr:hypothetical protein HDU91_005041 [Kappamyces sp. JEL0680]